MEDETENAIKTALGGFYPGFGPLKMDIGGMQVFIGINGSGLCLLPFRVGQT